MRFSLGKNKEISIIFKGIVLMAIFSSAACSNGLKEIDMKDEQLKKPLSINVRPKVLAIGQGFSVGIKEDGTVWTWGSNYKGILARTLKNESDAYFPGRVPNLSGVISVVAASSVLVLTQDGSVWSWGNNKNMRLGYEDQSETDVIPRKIQNLPKIIDISQSGPMGVALAADGVIWAWGGGGRNTLFDVDGGVKDRRPPTPIGGLPPIKKISSSDGAIAAIDESGRLWTIGYGLESGRTNLDINSSKNLIDLVELPAKVVDVDLGAFLAGVVLLENGQVWTWGLNGSGQLGQGHQKNLLRPERIKVLSRIKLIKAYNNYMSAVTDEDEILYWGQMVVGPSPDPSVSRKLIAASPVFIERKEGVVELAAGSAAVAAIDKEGRAWYFGWNRDGERGTGSAEMGVSQDYVVNLEMSAWAR